MVVTCCACNNKTKADGSSKPELGGMLAYDSGFADSRSGIVVCNMADGNRTVLSDTWKIDSPCRPAFSPDGRQIVFNGKESGKWNIYLYDLTTGKLPVCLTPDLDADSTDPSFSADGNTVVFSCGGQLASLDISTLKCKNMTFEANASYADPKISEDGNTILYSYTNGSHSQIGRLDTKSLSASNLFFDAETSNSQPVFYGTGSFCYVNGPSGSNCRICSANLGNNSSKVAFSSEDYDFADPAPLVDGWIVMSRSTSGGNYGICIGNVSSGTVYPINEYVSSIDSRYGQRHPCYIDTDVSVATPEDGGRRESEGGDDIVSDTERPTLKGKIVYHSYTSYDSMDSKMYLYDFSTGELRNISSGWTTVSDPMNGHFSPDGKYITFMGIGAATDSWDIFLYDLENGGQPVNLTPSGDYRDEDPKFSFDGTKICFKRNGHLAEITVATESIRILYDGNGYDWSMPYYSTDDSKLVFSGSSSSDSYIACWDIAGSTMTKLYDRPDVVEYYPVTIDGDSFYYTANVSSTDLHDQLYKGFWDGAEAVELAFDDKDADYSDACPLSSGWLILCSTRYDSKGGYDLYIANGSSGAIYPLSDYDGSINTAKQELGPAYFVEK
ncbi:MAG: hypothetical protein LKK19_04950 [Bacteroidales bacterium]|jgi:Tol biopolymer transport system component|nr:hypothetical protein [Bacteroidales bacterium]MCI2122031.1 hypothetical protein [Bacteroidales bacterium]